MIIRKAVETDIPAIMEIYNYEVLNATSTFDLEPKTLEERTDWFNSHKDDHSILVCEIEGQTVAYASLSTYRAKEAYLGTAELSIYIHHNYRCQGIGRGMMKSILDKSREIQSLHTIVSVITGGNKASDHLHRALGFEFCGRIREAGYKFGKYLDIDTYQIIV